MNRGGSSVRIGSAAPAPQGCRVAVASVDASWRWRVAVLAGQVGRCHQFSSLSTALASGRDFDILILGSPALADELVAELHSLRSGRMHPAVILVTEVAAPDPRVLWGLPVEEVHRIADEAELPQLIAEIRSRTRRTAVRALADDLGLSPPVRDALEALGESLQRGGAVITTKCGLARHAGYDRSYLSRKAAEHGAELGRLIDVTRAGRGADLRRNLGIEWSDLVAPLGHASQGGVTQLWHRVFGCAPTAWIDDGVTAHERLIHALQALRG